VAQQIVDEGASIGVPVTQCRAMADVRPGINVTNYERVHLFDASRFAGVILDESSIIKHHTAKTFKTLCEMFRSTQFKLCCTATPAPNDYVELGTHAEFLGICTQSEMLAEYFVHDGGDTSTWRLKGHARTEFWKFVSSWGAMVRKPSDLGYDDAGYDLPPLNVHYFEVAATDDDVKAGGLLFAKEASSLMERRAARRGSLSTRVAKCAEWVTPKDEPCIIWCDLNAESEMLTRSIPGAVEVTGSMDIDEKERRLVAFSRGEFNSLVTKPSIAGFGMNWQHCARQAFVGVTDSWESYYQAVRRSWRFGQAKTVDVAIFASELEGAVIRNLKRKEADATAMAEQLSAETREAVKSEIRGQERRTNKYNAAKGLEIPKWL
jgi:hypothetical protein